MKLLSTRHLHQRSQSAIVRGGLLLLLLVALGVAADERSLDARAPQQEPSLSGTPAAAAGAARYYQLSGAGTIRYSWDSPEGQAARAACDVSLWPFWTFHFDGTLDTFTQTVTGNIFTPGQYFNLDRPGTELIESLQCGSYNPPGEPFVCCSKEMHYTWGNIGIGKFTGAYNASTGEFNANGTIDIRVLIIPNFCADWTATRKIVDCNDVIAGSEKGTLPGVGDRGGYALGNFKLELKGLLDWRPPAEGSSVPRVHISARLDLTNSKWYPWAFKHSGVDGMSDAGIDGVPKP